MVLLTSLMNDTTVQMTTPMAVFIAGAWHPKAHPEFRKAVESSAPCARPQVFVANHSKGWHCSWTEQEAFWNHLDENYSDLLRVVLNYEGSGAAELFVIIMMWAVVSLPLHVSGNAYWTKILIEQSFAHLQVSPATII